MMVTLRQLLGPVSAIPASRGRQKRRGGGSGSSQTHAGDKDHYDYDYNDDLDFDQSEWLVPFQVSIGLKINFK